MKDALAIHRTLLERETLHEIVRLPSAITNADQLPRTGLPADRCLATRIYAFTDSARYTSGYLAALIVAAGTTIAMETVRLALGARTVWAARADLINAATDFSAELVCPVLLPTSIPVLADRRLVDRLRDDDIVYTPTGEPCTALGIRALDLYASSGARPVELRTPVGVGATAPQRSRTPRRATR